MLNVAMRMSNVFPLVDRGGSKRLPHIIISAYDSKIVGQLRPSQNERLAALQDPPRLTLLLQITGQVLFSLPCCHQGYSLS